MCVYVILYIHIFIHTHIIYTYADMCMYMHYTHLCVFSARFVCRRAAFSPQGFDTEFMHAKVLSDLFGIGPPNEGQAKTPPRSLYHRTGYSPSSRSAMLSAARRQVARTPSCPTQWATTADGVNPA